MFRPAAAKTKARTRAAAKARQTTKANPRSRPPAKAKAGKEPSPLDQLEAGGTVAIGDAPEKCWEIGAVWLWTGAYHGEPAQVIAEVKSQVVDKDGSWIKAAPYGAPEGALRRHCESQMTNGVSPELCIHRCLEGCLQEHWDSNTFHALSLQKVSEDLEWKASLLARPATGVSGQLGNLHQLAHQMGYGVGDLAGEVNSPAAAAPLPEKRKKGKRSSKKRVKDMLEQAKWTWTGTSLDPTFKVPRMKSSGSRKRKDRSSDSSGSSSSADSPALDPNLFKEQQQVRAIARRCPGLLARQTLAEASRQVTQGVGEQAQGTKPEPVLLKYFRQVVPKQNMGRPMTRELLTLSSVVDHLVSGQVLEALDIACQRFKAIEQIAAGGLGEIAERMELAPIERASLTSRQEAKQAADESFQEYKTQGHLRGWRPASGNPAWADPAKGKGKQWGKPWAKGGKDGKDASLAGEYRQQEVEQTSPLRPKGKKGGKGKT